MINPNLLGYKHVGLGDKNVFQKAALMTGWDFLPEDAWLPETVH